MTIRSTIEICSSVDEATREPNSGTTIMAVGFGLSGIPETIIEWTVIPAKMVKGTGGAVDLVANPEKTKILVGQTHSDKHGNPKIKAKCDLPATGARCVHTIVTELACFELDHEKGLNLRVQSPDSKF